MIHCIKYYFLLLSCINMLNGFSQNPFNNRYDFLKGPEVFSGVFYENNNFYLTGGTLDSTWYIGPTINFMKIGLLKIDNLGNEIWKKRYGNDSLYYNVGFKATSIVFNSTFYFNGVYFDTYNKAHQYLFKYNEQGDSLLLVHYFENDTTIETYAGSCKITRDDNLILSGVVDSSSYGLFSQMYLMKTDTLGNIIWWKTYGGSQYETCTNMDTCSDGGFVLGGWTTSFGGTDQDPYIVKTDRNGTFQWQKTINSNSFDDWSAVVLTTQDGNILSVTTEVQKQDANYKYTKTYFNKYDLSGNLLWRKNVGDTLLQAPVFTVKEDVNGNIVAIGASAYYNHIFKINANGDSLLLKQIYRVEDCTSMQQYGFDLALIDSGGYAITGFIIPSPANINNTQDAWLSTYDSLGCQLPDAPYNLTTQVQMTSQDTIIKLTWEYDLSLVNPNLVYMVLRYNEDVYAWDTPYEYCQSILTMDSACYLINKSFTDTVHCFTKRKYRVYAVDTTNQLTSCYSNEINVDILSNINELENNNALVKVYPNPNNGLFTLKIDALFTQAALFITDITGKHILQQNITQTETQLNLLSYPKGMYFYHINIENKLITGKIILN